FSGLWLRGAVAAGWPERSPPGPGPRPPIWTPWVEAGPLPALERGARRIGEGIEAALARELDGAQAQPIERAQHIEIALMVPSRFTPQEHGHAAAGDDAPGVRDTRDDGHPVGMLLRVAMGRLDQAQGLLGCVVVAPGSVGP